MDDYPTVITVMWLPALAYSLFGLILGSFLNVCIYRIPRRESVVWPGSHCPSCGAPVRPYDNIPLVSYLLLKGKCRSCKGPISLRYPLVELSAGIAFYACARAWQLTPPTFVNSLFIGLIIVLALIDYDHQILPNVFTLPGTLIGILLSPFQDPALYREAAARAVAVSLSPESPETMLPWVASLLGAIVGAAFILLTQGYSRGAVRPVGQKPRRKSVNPRGGGRFGSSTTLSHSAPVLETENGLSVCSGSSLLNRATNGPLKTNRFPTILSCAFSEKTSLGSLSGEAADSRSLSAIVSCPVANRSISCSWLVDPVRGSTAAKDALPR